MHDYIKCKTTTHFFFIILPHTTRTDARQNLLPPTHIKCTSEKVFIILSFLCIEFNYTNIVVSFLIFKKHYGVQSIRNEKKKVVLISRTNDS